MISWIIKWFMRAAACAVMLVTFLWWQNYGLDVSCVQVKVDIPESLRILHLSDLHGAWFGDGQARIARKAERLQPDVIVITGDFIDARHDEQAAVALIGKMAEIALTCCVTGNQEANEINQGTGRYERMMEATGCMENVRWLSAETIVLSEGVTLTGADDLYFMDDTLRSNDTKAYAEYISGLHDAADGGYSILLAHRPEQFESYAAAGFDLTLSGHAHGGQIRLPFVGGVFAPGQGYMPKYTSGLYEHESGALMYVNRGLGNSTFPQRIFNRPDMTLLVVG